MIRNNTLRYFAYGSNLSTPRLHARVSSARKLCVAVLERHRLVFHKVGRDGSAKCDALLTGRADDRVHGVVFELPARARRSLDRVEGLGNGYEHRMVTVTLHGGLALDAFTYSATLTNDTLQPYDWYLEHVVRGALEHGFPDSYLAAITGIAALPDPDPVRRARELEVYSVVRR